MCDTTAVIDTLGLMPMSVMPDCTSTQTIDFVYKISMVVIAVCNLLWACIIFYKNINRSKTQEENSRKLSLLKTLILDHNIAILYDFFEQIRNITFTLQRENLSLESKTEINGEMLDACAVFRKKFLLLFSAVDKDLYPELLAELDKMSDKLTERIFDLGVNLTHIPKYEELIETPIENCQIKILGLLFNYSNK